MAGLTLLVVVVAQGLTSLGKIALILLHLLISLLNRGSWRSRGRRRPAACLLTAMALLAGALAVIAVSEILP